MSCCGSHKHNNQINSQENKINSQENNTKQDGKKSSWVIWIIVIFLILLLIFSFIR